MLPVLLAVLLSVVPGPEGDIELLRQKASEKAAFQLFGLLVDKWRWDVFTGNTPYALGAARGQSVGWKAG